MVVLQVTVVDMGVDKPSAQMARGRVVVVMYVYVRDDRR